MLKQWMLILTVVLVAAANVHAKPQQEEKVYHAFQGWVGTPMAKFDRPEGKFRIQVLQKYALPDVSPFLIGSVIFVQAPKTGYAKEHSTVASLDFLKASMDVKEWITRHEANNGKVVKVYEATWRKANRTVRIYLQENENEISYSIANFRPGYSDSAGYESMQLQRHLADVMDHKTAQLDGTLLKIKMLLGESPAEAAQDPVCVAAATASAQAGCAQYANFGQSALDTCVQQTVASSCPDVGSAHTGGGAATTTTPATGGTAANNGITVDASSVLNSPNGQSITSSISSASNSLRTYERLFNVDYLIGGTMAVLTTGFVMGAIADGVMSLAAFLKELITNSKDSKARSEAFVKAMEGYKKIQDNEPDLEKEIDNQLRFIKLARDEAGGTENLLYYVQMSLAKSKAKLKRLVKEADKAESEGTATETCKECLNNYSEQAKLETQISQLDAVVKTISPSDSMASLCDKANRQIQKLSEAEVMMQNYRSSLFDGIDRWVVDGNDELQKDIEKSDDFGKRIKKAKTAEKKGAEKAEKMLSKRAEKDRDRSMKEIFATCMAEKEPFWSNVPGLGYMLTGGSRDACKSVAQAPDSTPAQKFKARLEDIKRGVSARRLDGAGDDVDVFSLLLKQAADGDLRPGYELNSTGYVDQKEWLRKVAKDNNLEKLGKVLYEKKAKYAEACPRGSTQ